MIVVQSAVPCTLLVVLSLLCAAVIVAPSLLCAAVIVDPYTMLVVPSAVSRLESGLQAILSAPLFQPSPKL